MSLNAKILAGIAGCIVLALLWFGRGGEPEPAGDDRPAAAPGNPMSAPRPAKPRAPMMLGGGNAPDSADPKVASRLDERRSRRLRKKPPMARGAEDAPLPDAEPEEADENADFDEVRNTLVNDPDPDERVNALSQLDFDHPDALDVVVQALSDRDPEVRMAALEELWANTDEPPLDILNVVLDDPDPEVRAEAVRMISDSEDVLAEDLLRQALGDADEDVRSEAADALDIELGPDGY
jgi:HEAT repeat protein